jgi:hypothetical protein
MYFPRPRLYEFALCFRNLLTLALNFEQDIAATKAYNEIDGLLDVIAPRADLLERLNEFVLVVISSGSSAHLFVPYVLVKSVMRQDALHILGGPAARSHARHVPVPLRFLFLRDSNLRHSLHK